VLPPTEEGRHRQEGYHLIDEEYLHLLPHLPPRVPQLEEDPLLHPHPLLLEVRRLRD
jgi:hypothetical protein